MMRSTVELRAGSLRLALRPDLGGAIAGLWMGATPVLRSTEPAALTDARSSACFPLVPYSNRIGHRRFQWQGQNHSTAVNFNDTPHSLHGVAWLRPWDVVSSSGTEAELVYRHAADAHWPYAFDVSQRFVLTSDGLTLHLAITNRAEQIQPVGLGWHPYLPRRPGARLQVEVSERWDNDASGLPTHRVAHPGIDAAVCDLDLDNCFGGWQGSARLDDEQVSLRLSSSLAHLVVFTPKDKPFYCVEPVSHVRNAIQMAEPAAHGLRALAPGATFEASMQLDIAML
jgi:aldose 1-epimerase